MLRTGRSGYALASGDDHRTVASSLTYIVQAKLPGRVLRPEQEPRKDEKSTSREPDGSKCGHVGPPYGVNIVRRRPSGYVRWREVDDVARHGCLLEVQRVERTILLLPRPHCW